MPAEDILDRLARLADEADGGAPMPGAQEVYRDTATGRERLPPRFQWRSLGKIGAAEKLASAGPLDYVEKVPLAGSAITWARAREVRKAAEAYQKWKAGDESVSEKDAILARSKVANFLAEADYRQARGETIPASIGTVIADMLPYAAEFGLSAGLAGATRVGVKQGVRALAGRGLAARIGAGVASRAASGAVRALTVGAGRTAAKIEANLTPELALAPNGELVLTAEAMGPATAVLKGIGEQTIAWAAEESGPLLRKGARAIPGVKLLGSKIRGALGLEFVAAGKGTLADFAKRMFSKVGFHGILEEMGEERVEAVLTALTGVDSRNTPGDRNTVINRLVDAIPTGRQLLVEAGAFAIPGVTNIAARKAVAKYDQAQQRARDKMMLLSAGGAQAFVVNNPALADRVAGLDQPSRRDWESLGFKGRWSQEERGAVVKLLRQQIAEDQAYVQKLQAEQPGGPAGVEVGEGAERGEVGPEAPGPEQVEEAPHALQERGPEEVPVGEAPGVGPEVGARVPEPGQAPGPQPGGEVGQENLVPEQVEAPAPIPGAVAPQEGAAEPVAPAEAAPPVAEKQP
ncbi:MAG: hypothetical protein ABIL09_04555, partial [Gemmatimonadota bacterium]